MFHSRGGIFHSFSDRFKIKAKLGDLLMRWEQGCLETGSSRRGTTPNIGNFAERATRNGLRERIHHASDAWGGP